MQSYSPSSPPSSDLSPPVDSRSQGPLPTSWEDQDALLRFAAQPALERIRRDLDRASHRLRPMLEHIEGHLFDPTLNVNQLKRACGIRDNSIAILFHSQMGQSPKTYLSERRLETSSRLLRDTDLKVWRIAEMVGYSGLGVFSKAFNRWAKQRPNAFRRQARELACELPTGSPSTVEFMDRALSGALTDREARRLLQRLMDLYPQLSADFAGELADHEALPTGTDLAAGS